MKRALNDVVLDRRGFVRGSFLALLGGATVSIVGCAGSSPTSPTAALPPVIPQDSTGTVMSNHGHAATLTGVQMMSGGAVQISIKGTSAHDHMVELSADEVSQVRAGQRVGKQSTGTGHTHMVIFNGEAPTA